MKAHDKKIARGKSGRQLVADTESVEPDLGILVGRTMRRHL